MSQHPPPPFLRCAAGLLLVGLAAGCGGISVDAFGRPTDDAATAADVGTPTDAGTPADVGAPTDRPPAVDTTPPPVDAATPFCPAATCVAGQRCCESLRQCMPAGVRCPDEAPDAGPAACVTSANCAEGSECVFPEAACARSGVCAARIACLRAETFCSCTGVTYEGCRPDRPTAARGRGGTASDAGVDAGDEFCPRALCVVGTICCESARACLPAATGCGGQVDAGPAACTSNAQCRGGSWCEGNGCGTPGVCAPLGDTCPGIYQPVCGCDGRTYTNECIANVTGVRVAARGACPVPDAGVIDSGVIDSGVIDSGVAACRTNGDCGTGRYCAGDGCGTPGTCAGRPGACTAEYNPVCGCDGRTYGNACAAATAGVRVASRGVCAVDAGVIDAGPAACITAADCRAGNECIYPTTACARSGACTPAIACFVALPFCSCTGETYRACRPDRPTSASGECAPTPDAGTSFCATARCTATTYCCESARACIPLGATCLAPTPDAGTATCASDRDCATGLTCCASTGRCYSPACLSCCMPRPGACTANSQCGAREWCSGTGCGTAGTCAPMADACPTIYAPVCGCDGRTYGNECIAGASGVRVASRGACG